MVFCTYCGQSFTRDEHLERHILTHTNVKPFRCFSCHMTFARRDLLQRHYTVHGKEGSQDPNAANGMMPKTAGRTPIACHNCAKTKTKCDKKFPCTRCASRNLRCTARPTRRTSKAANFLAPVETAVAPGASAPELQIPNKERSPSLDGQQKLPEQMAPLGQLTPPRSDGHNSPVNTTPPSGPLTSPVAVQGGFYSPDHQGGFENLPWHRGHSHSSSVSSLDSADGTMSMFDWSPMSVETAYAVPHPDMLVSPSAVSFSGADSIHCDPMGFMAGFQPPMTLHTPLLTPAFDAGFPNLGIDTNTYYPAQVQQPATPPAGEADAVSAAVDGWTVFRCTPPLASYLCPKTARLNLERLQQSLSSPGTWSSWQPPHNEGESTEPKLSPQGS